MPVTVQVPASSANLGPAFDCAAIALNLYLRATAVPRSTGGLEVSYHGPNADLIETGDANLVARAIRNVATAANRSAPNAHIDVESDIPIGAGLGSSAAAIIAGTILGADLCGVALEQKAILRYALALENHPDNVAAALHGGIAIVAETDGDSPSPGDVLVCRNDISERFDFVAVTPDVPLATEKARSVLPAQISRKDAAYNLQRAAMLAATFFSGADPSPELFSDRLHQPHRAPLVPGIAECLAFRHDGLAGVFLSGAGSSVMALATEHSKQIGDALVEIFRRHGVKARAAFLKADNRGAQITRSKTSAP
jgi:homoserine kinase